MPDEEQTKNRRPTTVMRDTSPEESDGPIISAYGVASAVLGALSVAAVALGGVDLGRAPQ